MAKAWKIPSRTSLVTSASLWNDMMHASRIYAGVMNPPPQPPEARAAHRVYSMINRLGSLFAPLHPHLLSHLTTSLPTSIRILIVESETNNTSVRADGQATTQRTLSNPSSRHTIVSLYACQHAGPHRASWLVVVRPHKEYVFNDWRPVQAESGSFMVV
jgi:hypothetical protein